MKICFFATHCRLLVTICRKSCWSLHLVENSLFIQIVLVIASPFSRQKESWWKHGYWFGDSLSPYFFLFQSDFENWRTLSWRFRFENFQFKKISDSFKSWKRLYKRRYRKTWSCGDGWCSSWRTVSFFRYQWRSVHLIAKFLANQQLGLKFLQRISVGDRGATLTAQACIFRIILRYQIH